VQPYLISSLQHDPRKAIAALKMPVLILQGTADMQVPEDGSEGCWPQPRRRPGW
jgi:fermentation-respiration switch protein FrsA (DUF1100 family)